MSGTVEDLMNSLPCKGEFLEVGGHPAFIITPAGEHPHPERPWAWYAPTFVKSHPKPRHEWLFRQFLKQGICIVGVEVGESYGNPEGRKAYSVFCHTLCARYGMSRKACLMPQSRGGLMLYNWASENPRSVCCIAGIYPVCDLRSYPGLHKACTAYGMSEADLGLCLREHNPVDRLAGLAEARVPIFHVHGDSDAVVPLEDNSGELARRYKALGGDVEVLVIEGRGHEEASEFFTCQALVDFVVRNVDRGSQD